MPKAKPLDRTELLNRIKDLRKKCDEENTQRFHIERSTEYQASEADIADTQRSINDLNQEIAATRTRQAEMLASIPSHADELFEAKMQLMELMRLEQVEGYNADGIVILGKFSQKKSVDTKKLYEKVLQGDAEEFYKLSTVSQDALKEYAKDHPNASKELLSCIKLDSRDLVDVVITLPDAQ